MTVQVHVRGVGVLEVSDLNFDKRTAKVRYNGMDSEFSLANLLALMGKDFNVIEDSNDSEGFVFVSGVGLIRTDAPSPFTKMTVGELYQPPKKSQGD